MKEIISVKENSIFVADPEYKNTEGKMREFKYSHVYQAKDRNIHLFKNSVLPHLN